MTNPPRAAAGHLTAASAGGWHLWRNFECRTAGYPAARALGLGDSDLAPASDAWQAAAHRHASLWQHARTEVKGEIRTLLDQARNEPVDAPGQPGRQLRIALLRHAAKAIDRLRVDAAVRDVLGPQRASALESAHDELLACESTYRKVYESACTGARDHLRSVVADPWFREAVTWQNKRLVAEVLDRFDPSLAGSGRRRAEEVIAAYVQRYATKNDTIGFFGPVGWAQWGHGSSVEPGTRSLAARQVYFEDWAIQALAARLSADPALAPWLPARAAPHQRQSAQGLVLPGDVRLPLSAEDAALLAACDGRRTAREIAARLLANPFLAFDDEAEVFERLRALAAQQRLHLGFAVRLGDPWPERHLRVQLQAVTETALREAALAGLDRLLQAREAVSQAAGRPARLLEALEALDSVFEAETGAAAYRSAGETYGARTVVYEDCRREAVVQLDESVRERLMRPLELVLHSARWFCRRIADVYERELDEAFERFDAPRVPLADFWLRVQSLFYEAGPPGVAGVRDELARHWDELLAAGASTADVERSCAELAAGVAVRFAASGPGWPSACHQSPDVMIAAADVDAIDRGEFTFVLGEVHVGLNTLINHSALQQHAQPGTLLASLHADLGRPRILPLVSRNATRQPIRVQTVADTARDIELQFSIDALPQADGLALRVADVDITRHASGLRATSADGRLDVPLLELFSQLLSGFVADKFRIGGDGAPQRPRITVDGLVVQRRQWRVPCADLAFADRRDDDAAVHHALRQWARQAGLPRLCFTKMAWEKKPTYLDFDSPLLARSLVRQARKAIAAAAAGASPSIAFSEMLPTHEQLWMPLAGGGRCTSELRLVAIHADDRCASA